MHLEQLSHKYVELRHYILDRELRNINIIIKVHLFKALYYYIVILVILLKMSELSCKSSRKKGFTAPIIKKQNNERKQENDQNPLRTDMKQTKTINNKENLEADQKSSQTAEKQLKKRNKKENLEPDQKSSQTAEKRIKPQASLTDSQYEEIFDAVLKDRKSNTGSKQPQVSLTDSQYVEIFDAVLKDRKNNKGSKQNTPIDEFSLVEEKLQTPLLEGSKEKSKKLMSEPTTPAQKPKAVPQVSPWGSHLSKQASQASSILKEIETESSFMGSSSVLSPTESSDTSTQQSQELQSVQPLPQQLPRKDQRKRLEDLQHCRNVGVWVFCDRMSCQKQRYLPYITDPQDVPDIWYCHMNKDPKFNNCQYEEQRPSAEDEEDMIYNTFTAGSVVWAHVEGYPWWPAMVDDDPDLEQYYWLLEDFCTVTHYHVVFFDEGPVTRAWVDLKNISSYARHDNKYKQMSCRGINFSRRIQVAKEQANDALTLSSYQRLTVYSFIVRYKGPISTSRQKMQKTIRKYKLELHKDKKADLNARKNTNIESLTTIKDNSKGNPIKMKRQIKENRKGCKNPKKQKLDTNKCITSIEDKAICKTKPKRKTKTLENFQVNMNNASDTCTVDHSKVTEVDMKKTYPASHDINTNDNIQQDSKGIQEDVRGSKYIETIESSSWIHPNSESPKMPIIECESETPSFIGSNAVTGPKPVCLPMASQRNIKDNIDGNSTIQTKSEISSFIEGNLAEKSANLFSQPDHSQINTEDTIGSIVEPSQMEDGASQDSKHSLSQSTIADYFIAESEDGVVPSSQQSLPFEE